MFFHWFYKDFSSHWGCCLRSRSSHVADVRLLQNQCFSIGFTSILALTGGVACVCIHRMLLMCVCFLKSMLFHSFYKHVGCHWGYCLRLRSSHVADVHLLQNQFFSIGFTSNLALTAGVACVCVHRMLLMCVCFQINAFPLVLQAFWLSVGVLPASAFIACC